MNKLFIVVRADLPPGAQASQLVHGAFQFAQEHPWLVSDWYRDSNNLVLLQVPDEAALTALRERCAGVLSSLVREPDLGGAATSLALGGGGAAKLVSSLPLALRAQKAA